MTVPGWWETLLLAAAVFRLFRLLADDTILDWPRERLVGLRGWRDGMPVPPGYRGRLAEFLVCPWCLGFWLALGWWAAWQAWPHAALVVATPFAISAAVGLVAQLDKGEEG